MQRLGIVCLAVSGLLVAVLATPDALADTNVYTSASTSVGTDYESYDPCPTGHTCTVVEPIVPVTGTVLESHSSDAAGASAEAHVNEVTGSLGVQAFGQSSADAVFNDEFFCSSRSPCLVAGVPTGGIPALIHFSLDGTITPPNLQDTPTDTYGGFLQLEFDYSERDIGGGYTAFTFEADFDDTLDHPAVATVDVDGTSYDAGLQYDTQPDGTVKVSVDWTQPFQLCPFGCAAETIYTVGGGSDSSIFGTYSEGSIDGNDLDYDGEPAGADFGATFSTTITSLDPDYSFFSNNGSIIESESSVASVPEPGSLLLFIVGLLGIGAMGTAKVRARRGRKV